MSLQAYLVFPQETFGKTIRLVLLKADYMAASEEKMKGVEKKPRKQLFIDFAMNKNGIILRKERSEKAACHLFNSYCVFICSYLICNIFQKRIRIKKSLC